jgi:hypothetical protein
MTINKLRLAAFPAALIWAAAAQGADSGPPASGSVQTTVHGVVVKPDPLGQSDRHLAKVQKSLPGSGSTAPEPAIAPSDPNAATGQQRKMMERASNPPQGPDPDAGFTSPHP